MNKLIKSVLKEMEVKLQELPPPSKDKTKIPTLENGVFKEMSPMLKERFSMFGSWQDATHGDWLSIEEMENIWSEKISDKRIQDIKNAQISSSKYWSDEASSLFKKNRLSLFSGSAFTNEKIYLLWLESKVEPELWVYDVNGEARYSNISAYLISFLDDDLSPYSKSWKLD